MADRMGRYLDKRADLRSRPLVSGSLEATRFVVVIPILAERDSIEATLADLAGNHPDVLAETLVICVVNHRAGAEVSESARRDNAETLVFLRDLAEGRAEGPFAPLRIGCIDACSEGKELGPKEGVGTARKLGLDWGVEVFRQAGVSDGVLVCLDADTRVEPNYLEAIREHFGEGGGWGAVTNFAHRFDGSEEQQDAIVAYEFFLRYHVLGLGYAASPYAFHSIGSTMACTAEAYVAVGGMNRRQAGEDFYFLEALAKTGHVDRIRATTVHPSSRPSWRVPFGTGKRVERFLQGDHDEYCVYHPETYEILRGWLGLVEARPEADAAFLIEHAREISVELGEFLGAQDFEAIWPKLQANARDSNALLRQFHRWFDAFMTLKLIHHLRDHGLPDQNTFEALAKLMERRGDPSIEPQPLKESLDGRKELLEVLRGLA